MKSVELLVKCSSTTEQLIDLDGTANIDVFGGTVRANNFTDPTIYVNGEAGSTITADTVNHIIVTTDTAISPTAVNIGKISTNYGALDVLQVVLHDNELSATQAGCRFNSLATLPLFSFDASKYPTSSGHTGNIPYTPIRVESGEFEFTDAGQLKCTSAGTLTIRNAHEFDGAEYITLTVDGVKTADIGSVTAGTMTASITQGSSLITVEMGTDDTLDTLNIQFRKEVE